jgi:hypothetical protein
LPRSVQVFFRKNSLFFFTFPEQMKGICGGWQGFWETDGPEGFVRNGGGKIGMGERRE